ncbi:DUF1269 domain-containing protein [Pedobacter steynii]|uniref:DUF1269 domain-containing protein n=1 Tax=Pedobacter steynii TaxID=430522 RepID=A0A1D7QHR0_9SPHI|nr:DUF1269 domain-containing protein [Pedobacter steynii]AOM78206.1 hypothetical protein BFS30_14115 [Pedobacter steynii]
MEKMIQALFNSEVEAFKGLQALQELQRTKEISVGETYVLTRDTDGKVNIRSAKNESEGTGIIGGGLIGGLVGLLAGPLGFIVGLAGGMIAGSAGETLKAEGVSDYLDQVSANIPNGKSVLIAHVWENWETPLNTMLLPLSTDLRRFSLEEQVFVPARTELDKLNADIKQAESKLVTVSDEEKREWIDTLADLNVKRAALENKLKIHTDQRQQQYQTWIDEHPDAHEAHDEERRRYMESRIKEQKERLDQLKRDR